MNPLPPPRDAAPWLVLDASGDRVRVALLGDRELLAWHEDPGEALVALFARTREALAVAGLPPDRLGAVVRCLGPGSVLGLRLAAVAAGVWCAGERAPASGGYGSLALAARIAAARVGEGSFAVGCEFKEGRRLLMRCNDGEALAAAETVEAQAPHDASLGPLFWLPMRRRRIPPPPGAIVLEPTPEAWNAALRSPGLVRPVPTDLLELGPPPEYRRWAGERHRAPSRHA